MSEIKREYAYRTTDGETFTGKNAEERAKDHQKRVDFRIAVKGMIPEACKIFGLEDVDVDEVNFLERVDNCSYIDCNDFGEFVDGFVDLYIEVPEIVKFLQLIERKFKEFK